MQLTTPSAEWVDVNDTFSTLDIVDYHAFVALFDRDTQFTWKVFRGGRRIAEGVSVDKALAGGDARDAAEAAIRADFQDRK